MICNIKRPASGLVFQTGTIEPFSIVRQDTGSLTITLEPYIMTNDVDCGQIKYSASSISGYDPFTPGHALIDEDVGELTFNDFHNYSGGMM